MKYFYMAALMLAAMLVCPARGENAVGGEKAKHTPKTHAAMEQPQQALVDLTVVGKLSKSETIFVVTPAIGEKVRLPRFGKDEASQKLMSEVEKLVGKDVTVVGKGMITPAAGDKPEKMRFKTITSVAEVVAAPGVPVAAPAAAPVAK
jgi:hypothetical protein